MAHNEFKEISLDKLKSLYKESKDNEKVLMDVKGLYDIRDLKNSNIKFWRM